MQLRSVVLVTVLVLGRASFGEEKKVAAFAPLRPQAGASAELAQQVATYLHEVAKGNAGVLAYFNLRDPAVTNPMLIDIDSGMNICYRAASTIPPARCYADLGGANGIGYFVTGAVALDGDRVRIDLQVFDVSKLEPALLGAGADGSISLPAATWRVESASLEKPLLATLGTVEPRLVAKPKVSDAPPPPPGPAPGPGKGLRYAAWGAGVGGVLALAAGAYFGMQASSAGADLTDKHKKQGGYLGADVDDWRSADDKAFMANVLFGVGAALGVTSGALFFSTAPKPGGGALMIRGSF